jgi:hypothetical protein
LDSLSNHIGWIATAKLLDVSAIIHPNMTRLGIGEKHVLMAAL